MKKAKYCIGCFAIKKDAKNQNRKIKRIKIKEEKDILVLPKCLCVQKETIVFDGDTLDIPFFNKDQYLIGTYNANFCNQFILLKKITPCSTLKQDVYNMHEIITSLGTAGGASITFGPETYLEKAGARWLGVKGMYNPIILSSTTSSNKLMGLPPPPVP